ncbi:MAG: hypothetical protein GWP61_27405 [Chloroflexi bacterium]|jgi:predicted dehydrogenase|nr:hypothetical protein [Chloroflexota bacterium]
MKVIQIGVGGFGRHWLRQLREYPGIDIVALVDLDEEVLDEAATVADMTADHCFRELSDTLEAFTAARIIATGS